MEAITVGSPDVLLVSRLTGLIGWPWIFFVEGMITVCFGVIAILFMAHTPAQAKFLSDEERVVALHRMKEDATA
jgi:MFS family permease